MSKIIAVILDVDGVLVDSRESNVARFQILLEKTGYKKPTREAVLACFHLDLRGTIKQLTRSSDEQELDRIIKLAIDGSFRRPDLYKFPVELKETLESLHQNYRLAIVTSRFRSGLDDVLDSTDVRHLFNLYVVKEDYDKPKPHPEALLLALQKLKVKASEAVYVGDTHVDIEAAKMAGMKSIHLALIKHNDADIGITTFSEIPNAVAELSGSSAYA